MKNSTTKQRLMELAGLQKQTEEQKKQKVYTKADIDKARASSKDKIAKIPEGPKLIQALGDELADMIKPNSSFHYERNAKDLIAHILSDPLNSGRADDQHGFALTTMPRDFRDFYTSVPIVDPAYLEKHQDEIIRIAQKSLNNKAANQAKMTDFSFQYPNTAFKNKAAELLDAMEIDMLDNFDDYEDWVENGMTSPSREVEDLTDELIALDKNGQAEYDDWMERVALPFIEKNNSIDESIMKTNISKTRLMELANLPKKQANMKEDMSTMSLKSNIAQT